MRSVLRQGSVTWIRCPYCEGAAGKSGGRSTHLSADTFWRPTPRFTIRQAGGSGQFTSSKDLTSRRQAENKFRTLFEKVQEGVFISTPEGGSLISTMRSCASSDMTARGIAQADIPRSYM